MGKGVDVSTRRGASVTNPSRKSRRSVAGLPYHPAPTRPRPGDAGRGSNVTNLTDEKGDLNVTVSQPAGSYSTFPIPPIEGFVTLATRF